MWLLWQYVLILLAIRQRIISLNKKEMSMSFFLDGIGKVIGKIADNVMGRIERLKNEKAKLENERIILLGRSADAKTVMRIVAIDKRIADIQRVLENSAKD
jgi:hypothetical protein